MASATLTEGLVDLIDRPIDQATLQRASLHVLDWVGCAVAGAATPVGRTVHDGASIFGPGDCTVLRQSTGSAPFGAAFVNGLFGNPLEMDDFHRTSTLHPGPVVIPAALAAAEHTGAPAPAFLVAIVKGYEAVIRIGRSVGPRHYAKWHNTSTCGPFGVTPEATHSMPSAQSSRSRPEAGRYGVSRNPPTAIAPVTIPAPTSASETSTSSSRSR